jgi:hypothetical protein
MFTDASPADVLVLFAGLFALAAGTGMILCPRHYDTFADELQTSSALILVSGVLAFLIGALFLAFQGGWARGSSVAAGIIGWLSLAEGVFLLALPDAYRALIRRVVKAGRVRAMGVLAIGLGLLCLFLALS